jgi:hypothetical protein
MRNKRLMSVVVAIGVTAASLLDAPGASASVAKNEPILSAVNRTFPVTVSSVPHKDIAAGQRKGYWLAASDGGVFAFGDAQFAGSAAGVTSHAIVGIAATKTGKGYWLVASDGGVFAFGDAQFYGSIPGLNPPAQGNPVVSGIAAAEDGNGYYLFTRAGGVYAFGSAQFFGSPAGFSQHDITGFGATPTGLGYWLTDVRGAMYQYGDAADLLQPVWEFNPSERNRSARVALSVWSTNAVHVMNLKGEIFTYDNGPGYGFFYGATTNADYPMTAMGNCRCSGYYQVAADGSVFTHGDATFHGSLPQYVSAQNLVAPIIGFAQSGPDPV